MQDKTSQIMTRIRDHNTTIQGNAGQYKTRQDNKMPNQGKTMQTNQVHQKQNNTTPYKTIQDNTIKHATKQADYTHNIRQ